MVYNEANRLIADVEALEDTPPSTPGHPVVRAFPFAFDTPNLLNGATLYTPTVGDILLGFWIAVTTPWNGTTPKGDLYFGSDGGWFVVQGSQVVDMENDLPAFPGGYSQLPGDLGAMGWGQFGFPMVARTTDPIKVAVSQDGSAGGSDPGSSQGEAILYLVTATPA